MGRRLIALSAGVMAIVGLASLTVVPVAGQSARPPAAKAKASERWTPPRTPWGDPDIQGVFSNADEYSLPFERPTEFEGRRLDDISAEELAKIVEQRQRQIVDRAPSVGSGPLGVPIHWFEFYGAKNSRAWMVADPPDGKVPPTTAEAQRRVAMRQERRGGRGPADSYEDRSLYDRCITRGVPGSMMPAQYGDAYQIVQGPGYVAINIEMVHETRLIPVDRRQHVSPKIRLDMGDARGHWEGNTLVVETTNFTNRAAYRNSNGDTLKIVERFTPSGPNTVEWSVTLDDPSTWPRPWTFGMNLTKKTDAERPFEYACHEGNYGLRNILSAARAEESAIADAAKKGLAGPRPSEFPREAEGEERVPQR
jgi:hypothetical protein